LSLRKITQGQLILRNQKTHKQILALFKPSNNSTNITTKQKSFSLATAASGDIDGVEIHPR
jgi:hypothetical protein